MLMKERLIADGIFDKVKQSFINENVNRFLNIAYKSKGLPKIENYSFNNLYNFLDDFFKWVSLELSKYDLVDNIDIEIQELLNKYPMED